MSKLYETLKQELHTARLVKDSFKVVLLSTLIGELDSKKSKGIFNDEVVLNTIKFFIKNNESISNITGSQTEEQKKELQILKAYLPQLLSVEETKNKLNQVISLLKQSNDKLNKGNIMKLMKSFPIDAKLVNNLIDEVL